MLVHDWLTGRRGGEQVLAALCRLFPEADLLTLTHRPGSVGPDIETRRIRASFINRLPNATRWYRHYLPLFPAAIEQFDLDDADLIVSTSHCAAKAVVATGRARHACYCHSPMRYAWDQFDSYFGPARVGAAANAAMRPILAWLARWDASTAHRVDQFLANSAHVADRIARYYNRQSVVVYPPVDTAFFSPDASPPGEYFLVVSALVPYKRIDVAIRAAAQRRVPLVIAGTGPDERRLRALAGSDVTFLGQVSGDELRALYRGARALLQPGHEDFGIATVEALACGRPVVALGHGGALEIVDDGLTGVLVDPATPDALAAGMSRLDTLALAPERARASALRFSPARFDDAVRHALAAMLAEAPC